MVEFYRRDKEEELPSIHYGGSSALRLRARNINSRPKPDGAQFQVGELGNRGFVGRVVDGFALDEIAEKSGRGLRCDLDQIHAFVGRLRTVT